MILGLMLTASPSVFAQALSNYVPTNNNTNQAPPNQTPTTTPNTQQTQPTQPTQRMGGGGIAPVGGTPGSNGSTTTGTASNGTTVINLGTITQQIILGSQETSPSITLIDATPGQNNPNYSCFDPAQCQGQKTPPVNPLSMALTFLIGVTVAGFLWYFTLRSSGTTFMFRTNSQIERSRRLNQHFLHDRSLLSTYRKIADAISMVNNQNDVQKYKEATAELEIFGSPKTIAANQALIMMLSNPNSNSTDIDHAKNNLIHCIRGDLGLN